MHGIVLSSKKTVPNAGLYPVGFLVPTCSGIEPVTGGGGVGHSPLLRAGEGELGFIKQKFYFYFFTPISS